MSATNEELATPVSVENLDAVVDALLERLMAKESYQSLRNNMGLGNTLGALPVANGGTGVTNLEDLRKLIVVKHELIKGMANDTSILTPDASWPDEWRYTKVAEVPAGFYAYLIHVENKGNASVNVAPALKINGTLIGYTSTSYQYLNIGSKASYTGTTFIKDVFVPEADYSSANLCGLHISPSNAAHIDGIYANITLVELVKP